MRLLTVMTVLLSAAVADACPYYYAPAYYRAEKAILIPQPVIQYSITYNAPPAYPPPAPVQAPAPSAQKDLARDQIQQETVKVLQTLATQLLSLEARMAALEQRLNQQSALTTYEQVIFTRCASCHDAEAPKKAKPVLSAKGQPAQLSIEEQAKVIKAVEAGTMPKDHPPLPESERRIIRERFEKGI